MAAFYQRMRLKQPWVMLLTKRFRSVGMECEGLTMVNRTQHSDNLALFEKDALPFTGKGVFLIA